MFWYILGAVVVLIVAFFWWRLTSVARGARQRDDRIAANDRNIAALARYYNGMDLDAIVPKGS